MNFNKVNHEKSLSITGPIHLVMPSFDEALVSNQTLVNLVLTNEFIHVLINYLSVLLDLIVISLDSIIYRECTRIFLESKFFKWEILKVIDWRECKDIFSRQGAQLALISQPNGFCIFVEIKIGVPKVQWARCHGGGGTGIGWNWSLE